MNKVLSLDERPKDITIGDRIRMRRRIRQLSLQQLSEITGLSVALLSQVERNLSAPSLKSLRQICAGLKMPVSWLFDAPEGQTSETVVRPETRRRLDLGPTGIVKELLTSDETPEVQMMRVIIQPGATFEGSPSPVPNAAKCGIVISGTVTFQLDDETFMLSTGDSFAFRATRSHRIISTSDQPVELYWVVTPAVY